MKKTNIKRIAAFTASILAVAALAVPMTALADDATPTTYTITINNDSTGHTYEAYQIFTGDLSGNVLSNIQWGAGVNYSADGFIDAIKAVKGASDTTPFSGITETSTAADIAGILSTNNTDATLAKNFADAVGGFLGTASATQSTQTEDSADTDTIKEYVLSGLTAGYYLVKDADTTLDGDHDAYTSYILKVVANTSAEPKSAYPVVDKQVWDDDDGVTGDNNGWGETADHDINDPYQYRLEASIPADSDLADYDSYKVVFNDTMGKGVTYDSIKSVKVGTSDVAVGDYEVETTTDTTTGITTMKVTIADIMKYDSDLTDAATVVEVIYNAHLNEDAVRLSASDDDAIENVNTVYLEYSNNPNWDSSGSATENLGKTPTDSVWVFTYDINVTKTDGTNPLNGAGFKLYSDENCATEVAVIWDTDMKTYRLVTGTEAGEEMTSGKGDAEGTTSGKITIAGLDTGTYYLKETTTPEGYNTCPVQKVVIGATHSENDSKTDATVTLTNADSMSPTIVNQAGSSLPSTGGIGTTLFYVGGGALALGAGVLLVSKKRMANK